jgi:hypothetical protein
VAEVLAGALLVLDTDGRRLTEVGALAEPAPAEITEAVAASRSERRCVRRGDWWLAAVVAGRGEPGRPGLAAGRRTERGRPRIFERAAQVTALLLLFKRGVADAEGRVRGDLLDELVAHAVRDEDAVRTRAARLGVDLDAPHVLVVVADEGPLRQRASSWAMSHAAAQSGLATSRDRQLVFLLPGTDAGSAARVISRGLGRVLGRPVTAGAAGPVASAVGVGTGYRDATRALAALTAARSRRRGRQHGRTRLRRAAARRGA